MQRRIPSLLAAVLAALWFTATTPAAGAPLPAGQPVTIYFFWGNGCPHCAAEEPFLADLAKRYPSVEVRAYEVWYHEENREPLTRMAAKFGVEASGVPMTFVGNRYWIGFAEQPTGREIEAAVAACVTSGCADAGAGILSPNAPEQGSASTRVAPARSSEVLILPLIGSIDLGTQSLALSTLLIAAVDGFNPCSLWVLGVLLALTLRTGSRKRVLLIGLVFVTVTSLIYVMFIAGLFTMFTVVSFTGWIRVVVALMALFFAAVNIKDYFWYKEGISFTISDEKKPGIYRNMRRVLAAGDSLPALIGATVVMSAGVSLVEFSCTAGFPVLWTTLLAEQGVAALTFVGLLALYMFIYQLDELGIFLVAVFSMRASRIEEKHGRILKLAGGMLMLTLAAVMLVNPNLMNQVSSSLIVFGIAFVAVLLVLLVHRVILPRFGVWIGTETAQPPRRRRDG